MSKALRIKIIDYLRTNDATTRYIDIRAYVLNERDSVEQRNEFKSTLDYLSNNKLIGINGSYEFLHWTMVNGLYNLSNKVIAAKLTQKGLSYHPENGEDELEAAVQPVLAVIKKSGGAKNEPTPDNAPAEEVTTVDSVQPVNYPANEPKYYEPDEITLPWYTETKPEEVEETNLTSHAEKKDEEPEEDKLPWYTEPKAEEVEETKLPWYTEAKTEEPEETKLPWYTEPKPEEGEEPRLPWYDEIKHEELQLGHQPVEEEKPEPVIYKFPPIDYKSESITKAPSPMVIEILNENLSQSLDAISNFKIKKPSRLTGDFERDVNVILKFILVVVLFLFFACIVWLYMG